MGLTGIRLSDAPGDAVIILNVFGARIRFADDIGGGHVTEHRWKVFFDVRHYSFKIVSLFDIGRRNAADIDRSDTLEFKDAQVEVKRKGKITIYECAIPLSAMPNIQADVGREIGFSLLVHNAENGNIRDLGKAAGLWPTQTNKYAWSTWQGVKWQDKPQYDNKIEWGLCSSKH